jgi:hypothetical protein
MYHIIIWFRYVTWIVLKTEAVAVELALTSCLYSMQNDIISVYITLSFSIAVIMTM